MEKYIIERNYNVYMSKRIEEQNRRHLDALTSTESLSTDKSLIL